jgi:hypothetical protein
MTGPVGEARISRRAKYMQVVACLREDSERLTGVNWPQHYGHRRAGWPQDCATVAPGNVNDYK